MQTQVNQINIATKPKIRRESIAKRLALYIPVALLAFVGLIAIFAPLIAPYDPIEISLRDRLEPPAWVEGGSPEHFLGTDKLGRDVLSRLIVGARLSLSVSFVVILIISSIGTTMGIIAGYVGGRVEAFIMRITDISMAFPAILIAMLLAVSMGPSFGTVVLSMSALGWAPYSRLIRGEALKLREADFVAQARIIGSSPLRIMATHIFPNIVNPLIIVMTLQIGSMILVEATLSFLGVGIPPPSPSWGNMVNDGRNIIDSAWWVSTFPAVAIGVIVFSGNFLGDWLRDKLDPTLRRL